MGIRVKLDFRGNPFQLDKKECIALARTFLRGSKLVLLDELTSGVDSINEGIILKAIQDQKHKNTFILVS